MKIPHIQGYFGVSVGRLELPTNGLKGHCSTIELHAHHQSIIVARYVGCVNRINPPGLVDNLDAFY